MSIFSKDDPRLPVIGPLIGILLGSGISLFATHLTLAENRKLQVEHDQRQAYSQLMGEKAELLTLLQLRAGIHDKFTFYQDRAVELALAVDPKVRLSPALKRMFDPQFYQDNAIQQERNADHYNEEVIESGKKMFESIGFVQLSFPPTQQLDTKIAAVQSMLTRTLDPLPPESLLERMTWVAKTQDAEKEISDRQKQHTARIEEVIQPLTDLLSYLAGEMSKKS